jgi:hypothetical protein
MPLPPSFVLKGEHISLQSGHSADDAIYQQHKHKSDGALKAHTVVKTTACSPPPTRSPKAAPPQKPFGPVLSPKEVTDNLAAAEALMQALTIANIGEMAALKVLSPIVDLIIHATCVLQGLAPHKEEGWSGTFRKMRNEWFKNLLALDRGGVSLETLVALRPIVETENFKYAIAIKSSKAAATLLAWVTAVYEYSRTANDEVTAPADRARLRHEGAARALAMAREHLSNIESVVLKLEEELKDGPASTVSAAEAREIIRSSLGDPENFAKAMGELAGFRHPPSSLTPLFKAICLIFGFKVAVDSGGEKK